MKDHTPSRSDGSYQGTVKAGGLLLLMSFAFLLCFCSLLPVALLLSFVFNALVLGSSLFATLAQEREKRTIDALRLTQLSSLDILLLKSRRELRMWARGNAVLFVLMVCAGWIGGEPLAWVVSGAVALAAGGLFSIAMALAVSTRSETTSAAVVSGWVSKGAWLVGLPLLDKVVEAVFVLKQPLSLFSYLDPAWVALRVGDAAFFEVGALPLAGVWLGALASAVLAALLVLQSSRLIDASFETAASLDDRTRHSAYTGNYVGNLQDNPFFVRELAWQMRSGAGRWPGYAVFLTLFLAPFLYGVAQNQKVQDTRPVKIVRQDILTTAPAPPVSGQWSDPSSSGPQGCEQDPSLSGHAPQSRQHGHFCISRFMGLPVGRHNSYQETGYRSVITSTGNVEQVSEATLQRMTTQSEDGLSSAESGYVESTTTRFQFELGRGLLTGLLLTVIYLFVRGGAFMAGSVTGEKERRAWDQIALTGVTPETFIQGKLAAVLTFPVRQMLLAAPVLCLFAVYKVITPMQLLLSVTLLVGCFLAAGTLGMAASILRPTSHQAQGAALCGATALMVLPFNSAGWMVLGGVVLILLGRTSLSQPARFVAFSGTVLAALVGGASVSPVAAVMTLCGSTVTESSMIWNLFGESGVLLWSTLSMFAAAGLFYQVAVSSLNNGGSVEAD